MSAEHTSPSASRRNRPQILLACSACRQSHVKCDGATPVCTRCAATARRCTYLPSRRGLWRRTSQLPPTPSAAPPPPSQPSNASEAADSSAAAPLAFSAGERNHYVGLYYARFHAAHPLLVPRAHFQAQDYPDVLVTVVCLVGKHCTHFHPSEGAEADAIAMVADAHDADNGHRIQAFVLLAWIFMGSNDVAHVNDCLDHATVLARQSELDTPDRHPPQEYISSLRRESLLRTWWELYFVDALAALQQGRPPKLDTRTIDALLDVPCTESQYETGEPAAQPLSYHDFECRAFLPNPPKFSSHFYRCEAIGIVRSVLPLCRREKSDAQAVDAASSAIASWTLQLSETSYPLSDTLLECDHLLIQAHLLVQAASIFLHFPRSNLLSSKPSAIDAICLAKAPRSVERSNMHTAQTLAALNELCNMASIVQLRDNHSPLVISPLLLGCAVQLSVASRRDKEQEENNKQCRHRVILLLSALKRVGKAWPAVQSVVHLFAPFADLIFSTPNDDQGRLANPASSSATHTVPTSYRSALDGNQQDPAMRAESALFENAFDSEWFNFFQSET